MITARDQKGPEIADPINSITVSGPTYSASGRSVQVFASLLCQVSYPVSAPILATVRFLVKRGKWGETPLVKTAQTNRVKQQAERAEMLSSQTGEHERHIASRSLEKNVQERVKMMVVEK
jgi:hypothetical protein